jgi:hypothetical protein
LYKEFVINPKPVINSHGAINFVTILNTYYWRNLEFFTLREEAQTITTTLQRARSVLKTHLSMAIK